MPSASVLLVEGWVARLVKRENRVLFFPPSPNTLHLAVSCTLLFEFRTNRDSVIHELG